MNDRPVSNLIATKIRTKLMTEKVSDERTDLYNEQIKDMLENSVIEEAPAMTVNPSEGSQWFRDKNSLAEDHPSAMRRANEPKRDKANANPRFWSGVGGGWDQNRG